MNPVDAFLNKITMYRLVLYGLTAIAATALALSTMGLSSFKFLPLAGSLGILLAAGAITHYALRFAFRSGTGCESWIITALILFLILRPAENVAGYGVLVFAIAIAMTSKYVLAMHDHHIFNPAAVSLVILGLLGSGEVYWWVGSANLLPAVLLVGLLVARKLRRFKLVGAFSAVALLTLAIAGDGMQLGDLLKNAILSGPLVFFATIMLTEPATAPPKNYQRVLYGALVGLLYGAQLKVGPVYMTPEMSLVLGNLLAYAFSNKHRYYFNFVQHEPQGGGVYEFVFNTDQQLDYQPGQYMEWTLPHHLPDSRGNRRYLSLASAPDEVDVRIGVRIDPEHSSSFKRALLALRPGDKIWTSQLGGDFTLPDDTEQPLVFIAGGVGITPFRSMVKHMLENDEQRDITLFYSSNTADGFTYWSVFNQALRYGVKPYYIITGDTIPVDWWGLKGLLNPQIITEKVPEYHDALFYLSGPNAMVVNYKKMLRSMGVPARHIKTDYFPGY